uniref:Uncharacterized protein n=1 Tax=Anopheles atroparvus TaxID=41427 RepID=A0A182IM56_ANOAO
MHCCLVLEGAGVAPYRLGTFSTYSFGMWSPSGWKPWLSATYCTTYSWPSSATNLKLPCTFMPSSSVFSSPCSEREIPSSDSNLRNGQRQPDLRVPLVGGGSEGDGQNGGENNGELHDHPIAFLLGKVGCFRLEAVLVRDVVDGVHLAIVGGERVRAAHDQGRVLVVELLQLGLLLALDTVAGVELEVVPVDAVVVVVVLQHLGVLFLASGTRRGEGERHQAGDEQENGSPSPPIVDLDLGNVRSVRLESVLVRNVGDGVDLAVVGGVAVRSAHGQSGGVAQVLQLASLLRLDAVARLVRVVVALRVDDVVELQRFGFAVRDGHGHGDGDD